jgi:hypothetical protein
MCVLPVSASVGFRENDIATHTPKPRVAKATKTGEKKNGIIEPHG